MVINSYIVKLLNTFVKSRGCKLCLHSTVTDHVYYLRIYSPIEDCFLVSAESFGSIESAAEDLLRRIQHEMTERKCYDSICHGLNRHMIGVPKFDSLKELEIQLVLAGVFDSKNNVTTFKKTSINYLTAE